MSQSTEASRAANKRWRERHPERHRKKNREWAAKNWNGKRHNIKSRYGISLEEYERLIAEPCAICGDTEKPRHLDHCHTTKKVRQALCRSCNLGLGHFNENPDILRAAMNYLKSHL